MRIAGTVLLFVLLLAAGAFLLAGRAAPPAIEFAQPGALVGREGTLAFTVAAPRGALSSLEVALEQNGTRVPLGTLADNALTLAQAGEDLVSVSRPLGRTSVPQLAEGPARIVVTAARPVLFGLRQAAATATRDFTVRLTPPRVGIVSLHHFINHGGSELVVYRATPPDVVSGVLVGDREFPGYPASAAGVTGADPSLHVAFFALAWDQDLGAPIRLFARDAAGNLATAPFDYRVFPKPFRASRIDIPDTFLQRVVPAILENTPSLTVDDPGDLLAAFLRINRDLRHENNATIEQLAARTGDRMLWSQPFLQLGNSKVEASFADQRTYLYHGEEVDRQVHLGFDLAVTARIPVRAANDGVVVFAGWLGIYGNCVVVDHGLGVQSLYAHLSSVDVKDGDRVSRDSVLGRSGMTGLAGGDHLHFTMLVHGVQVTPVDWWSRQWVEDRILRKLREAGAPAGAQAAAAGTP